MTIVRVQPRNRNQCRSNNIGNKPVSTRLDHEVQNGCLSDFVHTYTTAVGFRASTTEVSDRPSIIGDENTLGLLEQAGSYSLFLVSYLETRVSI